MLDKGNRNEAALENSSSRKSRKIYRKIIETESCFGLSRWLYTSHTARNRIPLLVFYRADFWYKTLGNFATEFCYYYSCRLQACQIARNNTLSHVFYRTALL